MVLNQEKRCGAAFSAAADVPTSGISDEEPEPNTFPSNCPTGPAQVQRARNDLGDRHTEEIPTFKKHPKGGIRTPRGI